MRPSRFAAKSAMRNFLLGILLVVFSSMPSIARAEGGRTPQTTTSGRSGYRTAPPAQLDVSPGSSYDYGAREAAAPELAGFAGGDSGIYIGSGAVVIVLLVVLIILVIR